ncbi:MAG: hypothetical protein QG646_3445 [Euryarchaeota archaeon]|nr:hypothetical protein [Euryarchaeota archaeon]
MLQIEWNKKVLEHEMRIAHHSLSIIDRWIPIFVYINDIEISGQEDIPEGDVSHLTSFFPELMSIFMIIDPERLGRKEFIYSRKNDNRVTGGGFEFTVELDKKTDTLTINHTNRGIREWRTVTIPLKEFAEGALSATKEVISDIERISPYESADDDLISLKMDYNTIRSWYEERYGVPVEVKYVIPERFY